MVTIRSNSLCITYEKCPWHCRTKPPTAKTCSGFCRFPANLAPLVLRAVLGGAKQELCSHGRSFNISQPTKRSSAICHSWCFPPNWTTITVTLSSLPPARFKGGTKSCPTAVNWFLLRHAKAVGGLLC